MEETARAIEQVLRSVIPAVYALVKGRRQGGSTIVEAARGPASVEAAE